MIRGYYSRLLSREVFLCACAWKSRGSQRDMGQNAPYLCIAKRVTGHGVNSNWLYGWDFLSINSEHEIRLLFFNHHCIIIFIFCKLFFLFLHFFMSRLFINVHSSSYKRHFVYKSTDILYFCYKCLSQKDIYNSNFNMFLHVLLICCKLQLRYTNIRHCLTAAEHTASQKILLHKLKYVRIPLSIFLNM